MILITGSEGLIGRALCRLLRAEGVKYEPFDLKFGQDIRHAGVWELVRDADAVVHLAALTRVKRCEIAPGLAHDTNVSAVASLIGMCVHSGARFVLVSSREVYGEQDFFPVKEDAPQKPKNTYARSKAQAERLAMIARANSTVVANVVRLSSVYGDTQDHPDRVVPAFAKAVTTGAPITLAGETTTLDLTHVSDVARGLKRLSELTENIPPVHLVSGRGTMLKELAGLHWEAGGTGAVRVDPPDPIHVSRFVGDPARAKELIGWETTISLEAGFSRLVSEFKHDRVETAALG